jgi:hypothetical protein
MELQELNKEDVLKLFKYKQSKEAQKILEVVIDQTKFKDAFLSEVGQALLQDIGYRLEELFPKIVNEKITEQEMAEFRALKFIVERWINKIDMYIKNIQGIKNI